jgi:hypothetical protein
MTRLPAEPLGSCAMVGVVVDRLSGALFPRVALEGRVIALTLMVENEPGACSAAQRLDTRLAGAKGADELSGSAAPPAWRTRARRRHARRGSCRARGR